MEVSVIIPTFNEQATIAEVIRRVEAQPMTKEIIVIDDGSTDGTPEVLREWHGSPNVRILYHARNQGKGAGIRTGIAAVTKEVTIIQDADLEYDPQDYQRLLQPLESGEADIVYGSRFLGISRTPVCPHLLGNRALTLATNVLYNHFLTDMETGYKAFRTPILKSLRLRCNRFDFEPEITAKILKQRYRIREVPIRYTRRDHSEGKKITWRDGIPALWALLRFRFMD